MIRRNFIKTLFGGAAAVAVGGIALGNESVVDGAVDHIGKVYFDDKSMDEIATTLHRAIGETDAELRKRHMDAIRGTPEWVSICSNGKEYFAVAKDGQVMRSPDGITWTAPGRVHDVTITGTLAV